MLAACTHQRPLASSSLKDAVAPPLILLLDLDETLIRPKLQRVHASRTLSSTDFRILIDGSIECQASLRPGLQEFFDWIRERRASGHIAGPWIYGQGAKKYIAPVLRQLDPKKEIFGDRILAKPSCTPLKNPWPWVLKGLTHEGGDDDGEDSLSSANVSRMVLVDNNIMSAILHPENTLVVRDWLADGAEDTELARVAATLDAAISADAADGASGDYAGQLAKTTPRFDGFRDSLADIYARMQEPPDSTRPLKTVLIETWEEACEAKRKLLDLSPGQV